MYRAAILLTLCAFAARTAGAAPREREGAVARFGAGRLSSRGWIFDFLTIRLDADLIVDRVSKALLTAEVFLGDLDGDVDEQKLNLVPFPSGIPAQAGAGPAEIMWGQVLKASSLGAVLYDMPHNSLCYAGSPGLACAANAPKHAAFAHAAGHEP